MSISVTVKRNDFKKIAVAVPVRATAAVTTTAAGVARAAASHSRVATGAMRAGWRVTAAGPFASQVINDVEYAKYHEFGTHKMAAQPMLTPGIEQGRPAFLALLGHVFDG